jgi:hypothetical protein
MDTDGIGLEGWIVCYAEPRSINRSTESNLNDYGARDIIDY